MPGVGQHYGGAEGGEVPTYGYYRAAAAASAGGGSASAASSADWHKSGGGSGNPAASSSASGGLPVGGDVNGLEPQQQAMLNARLRQYELDRQDPPFEQEADGNSAPKQPGMVGYRASTSGASQQVF